MTRHPSPRGNDRLLTDRSDFSRIAVGECMPARSQVTDTPLDRSPDAQRRGTPGHVAEGRGARSPVSDGQRIRNRFARNRFAQGRVAESPLAHSDFNHGTVIERPGQEPTTGRSHAQRPRTALAAAVAALAVLAVVASCGSAATPSAGAGSETAASSPVAHSGSHGDAAGSDAPRATSPASPAQGTDAESPSPATAGTSAGQAEPADAKATDIPAACAALIKVDSVPPPDGGPDQPATPEGNKEFGKAVLPPLKEAEAKGGLVLATSLKMLIPAVEKAAADGASIPDDGAVQDGIVGFHTWAHKNCGYQNVDVTAVDYKYEGIPANLKAGPTSIGLMNESDKGEFHIALVSRAKDATIATVEDLLAVPPQEFESRFDMIGVAAAPPGGAGGLLVDLTPGRYFVVCPIPVGGDESSGDMHMMHGMVATFEVS